MSADATPAAAELPPTPPGLHGYDPPPGCTDEVLVPGGAARPHWQPFLAQLEALTVPDLTHRWREARRLVHESGLAYQVEDNRRGGHRPWQLDPVPLIVSAREAAALEAGLTQRARLLDAILADLYGPQDLLTRGLLPPEIVFGHPGFLRGCHHVRVPGDRRLVLYAADLARGPDGAVRVLGDRTEAPAGVGFALENRIVLSRMLPDLFRECRVQRLALFFHTFRETLRSLSPHNRDNPRIVLLTPGQQSEHYFGHAYLARYLGYTLAEGGDLTVRDNRVYLKLLGGLQPVDVIFRRVASQMCDPLELRGDSPFGVPGLLQAVRTGNVAMVNSLGAGLAESPALVPYLPGLCRELLGEELKLPSVEAWWCGDPAGLRHTLANLSRLVLRKTYGPPDTDPVFGDRLSAAQLQDLAARVRARSHDFVAQEPLALSTTPVLEGAGLVPRHLVIRAFLTARADGYFVMPGGLTRVAADPHSLQAAPETGYSKDTWVLSQGPVSSFSLLGQALRPVELNRGGGDLPSRAADNLFWLGRYAARAEGTTRLLRAVLVRLTESSGLRDAPELPALMHALAQMSGAAPANPRGLADRLPFSVGQLRGLIFDAGNPGSLAATLRAVCAAARLCRDRVSTDMWRILAGIDLAEGEGGGDPEGEDDDFTLSAILDRLTRTVMSLAAFGGLAVESMTRGHAWRFLDMGRKLERALYTAALLRGTLTHVSESEGPLLEALLEVFDSAMTYRRRYPGSAEPAPVLDLLLADEENPRSLGFQLMALGRQVAELPRDPSEARRSPEERVVLRLLTAVRLGDVETLASANHNRERVFLDEFLAEMELELPHLSDAITHSYLTHLKPHRQLSGGRRAGR